jgi:hypothetical protein
VPLPSQAIALPNEMAKTQMKWNRFLSRYLIHQLHLFVDGKKEKEKKSKCQHAAVTASKIQIMHGLT